MIFHSFKFTEGKQNLYHLYIAKTPLRKLETEKQSPPHIRKKILC